METQRNFDRVSDEALDATIYSMQMADRPSRLERDDLRAACTERARRRREALKVFEQRTAVRAVAAIVGGSVLYRYVGRASASGQSCVGVVVAEESSTVAVVEQAALRGLRGATIEPCASQWVVYWPELDFGPDPALGEGAVL